MFSYKCSFRGIDNTNQYEELIKIFLQPGEYEILSDGSGEYIYSFDGDKDEIKRQIYRDLQTITGKSPKWGILTGIRPVKLAGELYEKTGDIEEVRNILKSRYLLSESKSDLVCEILQYQAEKLGSPSPNSLGVYIGIPFCPTRCLYCSFTSNQRSDEEKARYLEALIKEIRFAGEAAARDGYEVESVYIGGGTPTSLTPAMMKELLAEIAGSFDLSHSKEFTIEAGRPDTITDEMLEVIDASPADRISINPQTMKDSTLELIGRRHDTKQIYEAFERAGKYDLVSINTDLIAGLPEETLEDFDHSIHEILRLGADNITLHTLAVKRASRLKEMDENFNYKQEELREKMLGSAMAALREKGYRPYYLYRQKHTSGNTENIGYCRDDKLSVYNVRIMEERQSILALGAGGISKVYFPEENRLERVANVSNYEIYIDRIDEMIDRKNKGFFGVRSIGGK